MCEGEDSHWRQRERRLNACFEGKEGHEKHPPTRCSHLGRTAPFWTPHLIVFKVGAEHIAATGFKKAIKLKNCGWNNISIFSCS